MRGALGKLSNQNSGGGNASNLPNLGSIQDMVVNGIRSFSGIDLGQVDPSVAPDAQGKVVLFRTSWCGYCKQAAACMSQKGIPFIERDTENSLNKADFQHYGTKGSVPLLVFGNKTMLGFAPGPFDQAYTAFKASQPAGDVASTNGAATPSSTAAPMQGTPLALSTIQPCDTLVGKLKTIPVYTQANKKAALLTNLTPTDQAVYLGEESNGLYRVGTNAGEGWADKLLLKRASP